MKRLLESISELLQLVRLLGEALKWYLQVELEELIFGNDSRVTQTTNSKENQS